MSLHCFVSDCIALALINTSMKLHFDREASRLLSEQVIGLPLGASKCSFHRMFFPVTGNLLTLI